MEHSCWDSFKWFLGRNYHNYCSYLHVGFPSVDSNPFGSKFFRRKSVVCSSRKGTRGASRRGASSSAPATWPTAADAVSNFPVRGWPAAPARCLLP